MLGSPFYHILHLKGSWSCVFLQLSHLEDPDPIQWWLGQYRRCKRMASGQGPLSTRTSHLSPTRYLSHELWHCLPPLQFSHLLEQPWQFSRLSWLPLLLTTSRKPSLSLALPVPLRIWSSSRSWEDWASSASSVGRRIHLAWSLSYWSCQWNPLLLTGSWSRNRWSTWLIQTVSV